MIEEIRRSWKYAQVSVKLIRSDWNTILPNSDKKVKRQGLDDFQNTYLSMERKWQYSFSLSDLAEGEKIPHQK